MTVTFQDLYQEQTRLPKFQKGVSCLCWAYNESGLIEDFLLRLNRLLQDQIEDYEIVIVDDGSTDSTKQIIKDLREKIPQINLVENPVNMNVGVSQCRAIQAAKKEYLFWQTTDWSYDITHLRLYLELLKSYDVVAGTRRVATDVQGGFGNRLRSFLSVFGMDHIRRRSDTLSKAMVSIINYLLIRLLFRVPLSDYQNVCFYPTRLIQSFRYEAKSSFSNPEGLIKAYWKGARIIEVPIPFIARVHGQAKGTKIKAILASVQDILHLWFQWIVVKRADFEKKGYVERLRGFDMDSFLKRGAMSVLTGPPR